MHIVLKWISPCLCSNTRFLLDSAFAGIYGNGCHSPPCIHTHIVRVGICALLLKRCCTSSCFKGLCSQAHPLSPSLHKSLSHPPSLLLFPFIPPSLSTSFSHPPLLRLSPSPSHSSPLSPLSVSLSVPQTTWPSSKM